MKTFTPLCIARHAAIALPLALSFVSANAQTGTGAAPYASSPSAPYGSGYVGINLGAPRYDDNRCSSAFSCDDPDLGGEIYVGSMLNKNFGLELGYVDFDKQQRNGGDSKAYGVNVSLVGNIPADRFSFFGKVGSTYGWTKTNAAVGPTGDKNGWGLSYGAGVGYDVSRQSQLLIEWDRHRLDFAGASDTDVDMYSVGYKYRF